MNNDSAQSTSRAPSLIDVQVGQNVRKLRQARGMTMSDLAEALNTSHQQVQKYETGANRISVGVLYAISLRLVLPVEAFFEIPPEPDTERAFRLRAKMNRLLDEMSEADLAMASLVLEALQK